jgi:orotidine-5'-phosphate decarboxylase
MTSPIILALDTKEIATADSWISATRDSIDIFKIGLELFLKIGIGGVKELTVKHGVQIFLDLKLHDIPNTVGAAVSSVSEVAPRFLTVHASGGKEMVEAAVKNADQTSITAVTILTSISDADLSEIGFTNNSLKSAINLAKIATMAGATSIVCSPLEVKEIRGVVPKNIILITPGVRPVGSDLGDQKRAMTPEDAMANGANFVVIGRPITSLARDSLGAMSAKAEEIRKILL